MTRYKLEVEFEAEGVADAFDKVHDFSIELANNDDAVSLYSLRDLEGTFKMSAQFEESKEKPALVAPLYNPHGTHYRGGDLTVTNGVVHEAVADAPTPPVGLDPTLAALAGKA